MMSSNRLLSSITTTLLITLLTFFLQHREVSAFSNGSTTTPRIGNFDTALTAISNRKHFDESLVDDATTFVVESYDDGFSSRRTAMTRIAGIAFGMSISAPFIEQAYASPPTAGQVYEIRMGTEENPEELVFEPDSIIIKSGDTVRWIKNAGLTQHNVVFAPGKVPAGVNAEKLSMGSKARLTKGYLERQFITKGDYEYSCTPHCTVMSGHITVV